MNQYEMEALLEESETAVRIAAAQVSRRYRGYLSFADLMQEGNIWVLKHPGTVRARLDDGRRGSRRLVGQLAKHFDRLGRQEKAYALSYSPDDEAFYSATLIETCLPAVFDESLMVQPPQEGYENERGRRDPAESNNWQVSVLDVKEAWAKAVMEPHIRVAMAYKYGYGLRNYQIAQVMEVADSTVGEYLKKGVNAMINELGGWPPGRCNADCECGEGIGSRRVMSNAEARARTDQDYD